MNHQEQTKNHDKHPDDHTALPTSAWIYVCIKYIHVHVYYSKFDKHQSIIFHTAQRKTPRV